MPHLHLSLQAGDDMILKRMKRRHPRADAIALLREAAAAAARHRLRRRPDRRLPDRDRGDVRELADARRGMRADLPARLSLLAAPGTPAARMPQVPRRSSRSARRGCGRRARRACGAYLAARSARRASDAGRARASRAHRACRRMRARRPTRRARRVASSDGPASPVAAAAELRHDGERLAGQESELCRAGSLVRTGRPDAGPPAPELAAERPRRSRRNAPRPTSGGADRQPSRRNRRPRPSRPAAPPQQGWFQRLEAGPDAVVARSCRATSPASSPSGGSTRNAQELEDVLIRADLGVETAMRITEALGAGPLSTRRSRPSEVRAILAARSSKVLTPVAQPLRARWRASRTSSWSSASTAPARPRPSASSAPSSPRARASR